MSGETEPAMDPIESQDFVRSFVTKKLAELDLAASDELTLYLAQDIEDYLLDSGKTIAALTEAEILHIEKFIAERMVSAKNIL